MTEIGKESPPDLTTLSLHVVHAGAEDLRCVIASAIESPQDCCLEVAKPDQGLCVMPVNNLNLSYRFA